MYFLCNINFFGITSLLNEEIEFKPTNGEKARKKCMGKNNDQINIWVLYVIDRRFKKFKQTNRNKRSGKRKRNGEERCDRERVGGIIQGGNLRNLLSWKKQYVS